MPSNAANVLLISSTGEATWGSTGVAATRKLHGIEKFEVRVVPTVEAVPTVGWYGPGPVADETAQIAEFDLSGTFTYQEAPKIYNGLFAFTSASTCASTAYIDYHWYAPVNTTQACATYPLEFGPSTAMAFKVNGGIFNTFKLSGEAGSLWKFEIGGLGKNAFALTTGLSTTARADSRTVYPVSMHETQLRIVPFATGTFGSSSGLVSGTLISFELEVDAKRHLKLFAGSKFPGDWGDGKYEATLKIVAEFSSGQSYPLLAEMLGVNATGTTGVALQRQVTLWATRDSSAFVSAVNFAGIQSKPVKLWNDRDGNMTMELNLMAKFSTALQDIGTSGTGNFLTFQVCNDSSKTS
jgi:hypothetical protein